MHGAELQVFSSHNSSTHVTQRFKNSFYLKIYFYLPLLGGSKLKKSASVQLQSIYYC